jgi:dTDP-4-amino-4,6-dideoxygalactose transaminase
MIPYYSPNLGLLKILKAFWRQDSEQSVIAFFKELTGKEFVLLTSSCRAAMYLAYQSMPKKGNVIASPLTCKSALEPILYSGNQILFADVDSSTFNINVDIPELVGRKAFAIQAIHLGGMPNEMEKIAEFAQQHSLLIVEDCAQALGAFYQQKSVGHWGDIACFSLIKTGYGIGGGVLATNDESIYRKAKKKQTDFAKIATKIVTFRLIRSLIETHRKNWFFEALYRLIMKSRKHSIVW